MPPRPIQSVRRNAIVIYDPGAVRRYPVLAAGIAEIVALWSHIDASLGSILAFMLKGGVRASVAMYGAILNSQAQMAALEAAARITLDHDDFRLFNAVMTLVKRASAKRHKIAHWVWGYSHEIPDALVLINPDAILDFDTQQNEFLTAINQGQFSASKARLDLSQGFVYRERDFNEIINELRDVAVMTSRFSVLANKFFQGDDLRRQLEASPQIQEALKKIPVAVPSCSPGRRP